MPPIESKKVEDLFEVRKKILDEFSPISGRIQDEYKKAVEEVFNTRIELCNSCEYLVVEHRSCVKCACPVDHKAKYLANTCPEGKW